MRHAISNTTPTDLDDLVGPGRYCVQNVGTTEVRLGRTAAETSGTDGYVLPANTEEVFYIDNRADETKWHLYALSIGTAAGALITFKKEPQES